MRNWSPEEWEKFRRMMEDIHRDSSRQFLQETGGALPPIENARLQYMLADNRPIRIDDEQEFSLVLSRRVADEIREFQNDSLLLLGQFDPANAPNTLDAIRKVYEFVGRVLVTDRTPAQSQWAGSKLPPGPCRRVVIDLFPRRPAAKHSPFQSIPPPPPTR